jgi:hypothetical protein
LLNFLNFFVHLPFLDLHSIAMSSTAPPTPPSQPSEAATWSESVMQLLDEHHLVVLSDSVKARRHFHDNLIQRLSLMPQTRVVRIDGDNATDLSSFCRQLEAGLGPTLGRDADSRPASRPPHEAPQVSTADLPSPPCWRDMHSVIEVLRSASAPDSQPSPKRRYFLWSEADALLESDVELFCRLVNALLGVAAECEHVSLDPLMLQRVVFIGGPKLGAYAEDSNGQFCRWLDDDDDSSPFWEIASILDRPPVMTYRIDG